MIKIELSPLYLLQKGLDEDIANRHNVTYSSTHYKRLLALIVELGELANETRCFKYWSTKPSSEKAVVLEEYVDGLHFLLSLGIPLSATKMEYVLKEEKEDLTQAILNVYEASIDLKNHYDLKHYELAFQNFLNLIPLLGFKVEEVTDAYKAKLDVNYQRQINKY